MDSAHAQAVTIPIADCTVTFAGGDERMRMIDSALAGSDASTTIGYANVHTVVTAHKDDRFRAALSSFSTIYADGAGVYAAAQCIDRSVMQHQPSQNATDFNYRVLEYADARRLRLFLVGASESVIGRCAERLAQRYPGIVLAGMQHGYFDPSDRSVVHRINAAQPHILLVGMGHPLQELWIHVQATALQVPLIIAVGGFFNFFAGEHARAPLFMRRLHCEWLFRLILEPRRLWKRYVVGIPQFFYIVGRREKK